MSDAGDADDIESIKEEKLRELAERADDADADSDADADPGGGDDPRPREPIPVESAEEFEELIDEHDLVLVDFHAEWCGPCQMMEPAVEAVAADGPATVLKVDIDRLQGLAQQHGIRGVPTVEVYSGGERVEQSVGMKNEDGLRDLLAAHA